MIFTKRIEYLHPASSSMYTTIRATYRFLGIPIFTTEAAARH